jgi:hypothetical protein
MWRSKLRQSNLATSTDTRVLPHVPNMWTNAAQQHSKIIVVPSVKLELQKIVGCIHASRNVQTTDPDAALPSIKQFHRRIEDLLRVCQAPASHTWNRLQGRKMSKSAYWKTRTSAAELQAVIHLVNTTDFQDNFPNRFAGDNMLPAI